MALRRAAPEADEGEGGGRGRKQEAPGAGQRGNARREEPNDLPVVQWRVRRRVRVCACWRAPHGWRPGRRCRARARAITLALPPRPLGAGPSGARNCMRSARLFGGGGVSLADRHMLLQRVAEWHGALVDGLGVHQPSLAPACLVPAASAVAQSKVCPAGRPGLCWRVRVGSCAVCRLLQCIQHLQARPACQAAAPPIDVQCCWVTDGAARPRAGVATGPSESLDHAPPPRSPRGSFANCPSLLYLVDKGQQDESGTSDHLVCSAQGATILVHTDYAPGIRDSNRWPNQTIKTLRL